MTFTYTNTIVKIICYKFKRFIHLVYKCSLPGPGEPPVAGICSCDNYSISMQAQRIGCCKCDYTGHNGGVNCRIVDG